MTTTLIRRSIPTNPATEERSTPDRPFRCEIQRGSIGRKLSQEITGSPTSSGLTTTIDQPEGQPTAENMLFDRYRKSKRASDLDALVTNYQGLVRSLAFRFRGRGAELDDLVQAAQVGLLLSIDRFDAERGVPFVSFATPTILGELRRYFRTVWTVHMPRSLQESTQLLGPASDELQQELGRTPSLSELADRTGIPCAQICQATAAAKAFRSQSLDSPRFTRCGESLSLYELVPSINAGGDFEAAEDRQTVEKLLEKLPFRSRQIIELRFYQELTQSQIAKAIGLSQMQVSRVLRQAILLMSSAPVENTKLEDSTLMAA